MEEFETFWRAYPRRIAKGAARQSFLRALRKTTVEEIMRGVERYVRHVADKEPQYICHAATWLNQERWDDELEPVTIKPESVVRPARTVDEVKAFYRSAGKPLTPEIERARSVEDLPVFARMVPNNVVPMKAVTK